MTGGCRLRVAVRVAALVLCGALATSGVWAEEKRVGLGAGMTAVLDPEHELRLEATPERQEGWLRFSSRLCGTQAYAAQLRGVNGGRTSLLAGVHYRVPFDLLRPDLQVRVVQAFFPEDGAIATGWRHRVTAGAGGRAVSLWDIARWFTGDGDNFRQIRDASSLEDEELRVGQEVLVPRSVVRPGLLSAVDAAATAAGSQLAFGSDSSGEYARYSLGPGEALYSSVVIRFTGRIYAEDVNALAGQIAERSAITDVTDIPVGYDIKIPVDVLAPEFLPVDHPRRVEYEQSLSESRRFTQHVRSSNLENVTVVLDAGHGGRDVGASIGGVWESVYVYDIMLRVKDTLERTTAATVMPTTRQGSSYLLASTDVLQSTRGHRVLTDPPYDIEDSRVSSNLRWYLSNSMLAEHQRRGLGDNRILFVSIHADSLHPSLRGAMVYVPGLLENPSSYGKTGTVYTSRREVRARPRVSFSYQDRRRSEGQSRELADRLMESFRRRGLGIHPNKPVRDRVIRGGRQWVPAVLRFNGVPTKVLVEVCNLANDQDRQLIKTRAFRQRVAEGIVDGILQYYGESLELPVQVAAGQ